MSNERTPNLPLEKFQTTVQKVEQISGIVFAKFNEYFALLSGFQIIAKKCMHGRASTRQCYTNIKDLSDILMGFELKDAFMSIMKYDQIQDLPNEQFRRLAGVKRQTFERMFILIIEALKKHIFSLIKKACLFFYRHFGLTTIVAGVDRLPN